jgi:NAD(P)-dependent dehydrogenase (short-subunit alcohol dehydrogenase family)
VAGLVGAHPFALDAVGYSASKGAIIALTRDLAVKWAGHNILVNAVAPSFFPTRMSQAVVAAHEAEIARETPLGRLGRAGEIKGVVVFLAAEASSYVTGQVIAVDGGTTAM